jgi:uncharacterized membrane protein YkvA (DUF1232 family)
MPGRRVDPSRYTDPSLIGRIVDQFRLTWRLLTDPRVPLSLKVLIPALAALYTFSPIDIIPDFLLGLGQLDDLGIILAALALFARLAPKAVVEEHRAAMAGRAPASGRGTVGADDAIEADYSIGGRGAGAARQ